MSFKLFFAPLRLECGEKGLSCVLETREEEEGWGAISRVMLLLLFFSLHDLVS